MTDTIVLYHGGCRDGFCAAWVVKRYFNDTFKEGPLEFIPVSYGQEPPDCKGKDVIIVDFCYDLETMKHIILECHSLTLLDHHKTALDTIKAIHNLDEPNVYAEFNLASSGAGMAWDFYFKGLERPWLVDYVEDRDLWSKKLPFTDEVNAYIACIFFHFDNYDQISKNSLDKAIEWGTIALSKTEQYVAEVCKNVYFVDIVTTHMPEKVYNDDILDTNKNLEVNKYRKIPIVNICQIDCSEVLHELCKKYPEAPFSLYWFKRADGMYQYGLRSIGDFDVSVVAKLFGGGGHKNAAGFQLDYLLEELK